MKIYLITCDGAKGRRINLCITNNVSHAKNVCDMYKDRGSRYKSITDAKALSIAETDFGCQVVIM